MTDNDTKKEFLNSYRNLKDKVKSLEEQLQSLRESEESAKTQKLTDMPKGNKQNDISDYIVRIDNLKSRIIWQKGECMRRMVEIEEKINDLEDGLEIRILHKRYIELKPWEQICVEIDYSWRQTHYLHSKALNNINIA